MRAMRKRDGKYRMPSAERVLGCFGEWSGRDCGGCADSINLACKAKSRRGVVRGLSTRRRAVDEAGYVSDRENKLKKNKLSVQLFNVDFD
jgi:hypothetical protein